MRTTLHHSLPGAVLGGFEDAHTTETSDNLPKRRPQLTYLRFSCSFLFTITYPAYSSVMNHTITRLQTARDSGWQSSTFSANTEHSTSIVPSINVCQTDCEAQEHKNTRTHASTTWQGRALARPRPQPYCHEVCRTFTDGTSGAPDRRCTSNPS